MVNVKDQCKYCNSTSLKVVRTVSLNQVGLHEGKPYTKRTVRYKKCRKCRRNTPFNEFWLEVEEPKSSGVITINPEWSDNA